MGVDGGAASGLISEDGAIELDKGGGSVEPFVIEGGRLISWPDAGPRQSLKDGYLPMPSVVWRRPGWTLCVTAFGFGAPKRPWLAARYEVRNLTARRQRLVLALALRPFQVDGPEQFLNSPGGVSPIHDLAWDGTRLTVAGRPEAYPVTRPERFAVLSPGDGAAVSAAALGKGKSGEGSVHDLDGLASGALIYAFDLPPHARRTVVLMAPLGDQPRAGRPPKTDGFERLEAGVAHAWRQRLGRVGFTVPREGRPAIDTLRTSLAYMLISRNGPELRPGTRSYDRSWIRDGTMISEALLRLGEGKAAADYLRWYAPHQFASGQVPCCVDGRGADPTLENDSEGELIHLAAEAYRYGGDKALLRAMWPHVLAATAFMDAERRATANESAPTRGLLTPSISHEGYSSKPAYSYWDDFWGELGYGDAAFIAGELGEGAAQARLSRDRDDFQQDLEASIAASIRAHGVDYIPGAADLGDFDPTSTTVALSPGDEGERLSRTLLQATFERYWRDFIHRRDGEATWDAYTPYEVRSIGAFVRLGWRDRAGALLDYFLKDRRPRAWNGWAEVVGREARKPRFIGDMPHAWVASDYARSVLDMFAYERKGDQALVIAAGLPSGWFMGAGVGVSDLSTPYGKLTWSVGTRGGKLTLRVNGARPPGGYVFAWPFAGAPGRTRVDGRPAAWDHGSLRLSGPGVAVIDLR